MVTIRNLTEFDCFMTVARCHSFSKAAIELKVSKNSVSRFVTNLADRLGEKIFRRTTRKVYLTGFGEKLLEHSDTFWRSLTILESKLSDSLQEPSGVLRILASSTFSGPFLYKKLDAFHKKHPNLTTDILFSDGGATTWELDKRNIDILFAFPQVQYITDEWKYKYLGQVHNLLVVAPLLLKKTGPINTNTDLLRLPFITHYARNPRNNIPLSNGKSILTTEPKIVTNSFEHLKELCKIGVGAALLTDSIVQKELIKEQLIAILPNLPYLKFSLYTFCRASEYSSPKIRAFMNFF